MGVHLAREVPSHQKSRKDQAGQLRDIPDPDATDFRPWYGVGLATLSLTDSTQPFASNPMVMQLQADAPNSGIGNDGYWAISARPGVGFNLTFWAKSSQQLALQAQLRDRASSQVVASAALVTLTSHVNSWTRYEVSIPAAASFVPAVSFELVVANGSGTVLLDHVSLIPQDAIYGLFRADLANVLHGLKPGFVRLPGGNYLEGYTVDTRWNWKNALGNRENRSGHFNSAWGYWVTDGMGLYELMLLVEFLESQPQVSIYTGYSMGLPYVPLNESGWIVQDAVDLIEFVKGNTSTPYGQMRAAMGHPAPFYLNRLEVGNEEHLMDSGSYPGHYKLITDAIWAKYPDMQVVASGRWGGFNGDGSPCTLGNPPMRCDMWDDHYYEDPDTMAAMTTQYDAYPRDFPDVFVGEYAARGNGQELALQNALGEAAFLLGGEANGDKVKATSFAPLFGNVYYQQWLYNLVNFNGSTHFVLPSYYVQTMLQAARGTVYVSEMSLTDGSSLTRVVASVQNNNTLHVKLVNYGSQPQPVTIVAPTLGLHGTANITTLTSTTGPSAANSLDEPNAVVPTTTTAPASQLNSMTVPAWSLVIVAVPLGSN